jgi:hypothetical protein
LRWIIHKAYACYTRSWHPVFHSSYSLKKNRKADVDSGLGCSRVDPVVKVQLLKTWHFWAQEVYWASESWPTTLSCGAMGDAAEAWHGSKWLTSGVCPWDSTPERVATHLLYSSGSGRWREKNVSPRGWGKLLTGCVHRGITIRGTGPTVVRKLQATLRDGHPLK